MKRYFEKLREKVLNEEAIKNYKKNPNYDRSKLNNSLIGKISFHLTVHEWAPGVNALGNNPSYGNNLVENLYELDEDDIEYFKKKFDNIELTREEEYQDKLKSLNREYGR